MPTALIVEDEPEANKLLAMLLQLRGYKTISAFLGEEALEKIREHSPDVVFLDLMLPDMNGYDVCRCLKSSGADSLIPVVIVTARLTAENRIESFEVGADDYVPKPYTPDQIFEALEQSRSWRDQLDALRVDGEVPLDSRDDGETLRCLARLRRLLQARSGLSCEEVDRISSSHQGGLVERRRLVTPTPPGPGRLAGLLIDAGVADARRSRRGRMSRRANGPRIPAEAESPGASPIRPGHRR